MRANLSVAAVALSVATLLLAAPDQSLAAENGVTGVVKLVASPGREAELQDRLIKLVAFAKKTEPGSTYWLSRSKKDPSVFLLYERYPSQAAADLHPNATLPAFAKEYGPTPQGLLARPIEWEGFEPVAD